MNVNEKTALLNYLEFHLVSFCKNTEQQLNPDANGEMWEFAYSILNDMDESIIVDHEPKKLIKKNSG